MTLDQKATIIDQNAILNGCKVDDAPLVETETKTVNVMYISGQWHVAINISDDRVRYRSFGGDKMEAMIYALNTVRHYWETEDLNIGLGVELDES